jgi:hypothetical protein
MFFKQETFDQIYRQVKLSALEYPQVTECNKNQD